MRNGINYMLAFALVLTFASCKNSDTGARYIPKNAALVFHLNGKTLTEKLPWEEIQKNEAYKMVYADSALKDYIKDVLDNPETTGIDIANHVFIYMATDSAGSYAAVNGRLKDAAKFTAFTKRSPENTVSVNGDLNNMRNSSSAGIWNKDRFVVVVELPDTKRAGFPMPGETSDDSPSTAKRDLSAKAASLFAIKEKESLAGEKKFTRLLDDDGDMHLWLNSYALYSSTPGFSAMSMMNLTKLYEGSFVTATANFEKGKIVADFRSYSGKELTAIIKKYSGKGIDKNMVNKLPGDNLAALYFMNFKPEGIKALLDLVGVSGFANMGLAMLGLNLDDVVNAFKGDFVVGVNGITKDTANVDANFTFAASIKDKNAFDKILRAVNKSGITPGENDKIYHETKGDLFALGNKQTSVKSYLNASPKNIAVWDKLSGSAIGGFIDFQMILKNIPVNASDTGKKLLYDLNLAMWQDAYATGGKFRNGAMEQHIEVNLVDKNTNSLKQMNDFFSKLAEIEKRNKTLSEGFETLQNAEREKMDSTISFDTLQ